MRRIEFSLTIDYADRVVAAEVKPVGGIPATVVGQIEVAAAHQQDGVVPEPPSSIVESNPKVKIISFTKALMQVYMLVGLVPISKDGRAV